MAIAVLSCSIVTTALIVFVLLPVFVINAPGRLADIMSYAIPTAFAILVVVFLCIILWREVMDQQAKEEIEAISSQEDEEARRRRAFRRFRPTNYRTLDERNGTEGDEEVKLPTYEQSEVMQAKLQSDAAGGQQQPNTNSNNTQ